MIQFRSIKERPEEDQLCLCKCNEYCEEGVVVARYCFGIFAISSNTKVDEYVTGWLPLDDNSGLPM